MALRVGPSRAVLALALVCCLVCAQIAQAALHNKRRGFKVRAGASTAPASHSQQGRGAARAACPRLHPIDAASGCTASHMPATE